MTAQNIDVKKNLSQQKHKDINKKPAKADHHIVIPQLDSTIKKLTSKFRNLTHENKHLNQRLNIIETSNKVLKKDKETNNQVKINFEVILRNRDVELNMEKIKASKLLKEIEHYKKEQLHYKNEIKKKSMIIDYCQLYRVNKKAHKHNNNAMINSMKQTNEHLKRSILQRGEEINKEKQLNNTLVDEIQKLKKQIEIFLLNKNSSSTSLEEDIRRTFKSVESQHKHFTKRTSSVSYNEHSDESTDYLPKDSLDNLVYDSNIEKSEWMEKLAFPNK